MRSNFLNDDAQAKIHRAGYFIIFKKHVKLQ